MRRFRCRLGETADDADARVVLSVFSWLAMDGFTVDEVADMTATDPDTVRTIYRKFNPDYLETLSTWLGNALFSNHPQAVRESRVPRGTRSHISKAS